MFVQQAASKDGAQMTAFTGRVQQKLNVWEMLKLKDVRKFSLAVYQPVFRNAAVKGPHEVSAVGA